MKKQFEFKEKLQFNTSDMLEFLQDTFFNNLKILISEYTEKKTRDIIEIIIKKCENILYSFDKKKFMKNNVEKDFVLINESSLKEIRTLLKSSSQYIKNYKNLLDFPTLKPLLEDERNKIKALVYQINALLDDNE